MSDKPKGEPRRGGTVELPNPAPMTKQELKDLKWQRTKDKRRAAWLRKAHKDSYKFGVILKSTGVYEPDSWEHFVIRVSDAYIETKDMHNNTNMIDWHHIDGYNVVELSESDFDEEDYKWYKERFLDEQTPIHQGQSKLTGKMFTQMLNNYLTPELIREEMKERVSDG